MGPDAGLESDKDAVTLEPPLQHKKRIDGPPTSLSTEYFSKPADVPEYALLGQQEKFAHNVKYQVKQTGPGGIYKNKENFDNEPSPNKQLRMQKRIKPLIKERHPPVSRSSQYLSNSQVPLSPPPAPRTHKDNIEIKEAMKDKDLRDVLGDRPAVSTSKEQIIQKAENKVKDDALHKDKKKGQTVTARTVKDTIQKKDVRDGLEGKADVHKSEEHVSRTTEKEQKNVVPQMNEFVQTNMKKGLATSAPEAPADYALKYRARVAPPREVKKVSEYQKQFQWKDNVKTTPILGAEEIVFRDRVDLGPYRTDGVPRVSEYKRQFQPWRPETYLSGINLNINNSNFNNNNNNNNNNNSRSDIKIERKRKAKAKRSKSTEAIVQHDESTNAVNDVEVAQSDPGELASKLKKSHGKTRHATTEYRANFRSPTSFKYKHGLWRGACPPQLMPQITNDEVTTKINKNNNNDGTEKNSSSDWFSEVIELRRRAEEYRKRAQGTHFSRDHLVQLLAKQNECWDLNSNASTTIDALDLESPAIRAKNSEKFSKCHSVPEENSPDLSDVDEMGQEQKRTEEEVKRKKTKQGKNSHERKSRKMAWLEDQREKIGQMRRRLEEERAKQEDSDDNDDAALIDENHEGRLSTPELQQQNVPIRRHHLDLTTPSVGGAILTSAPSKGNKMIVSTKTGGNFVTASDDYHTKPLHKTFKVDNLRTTPIYGKPSEDTHHLRNDSANSDRPLRTQYVTSPDLSETDEDKENYDKHKQQIRRKNKNIRSSDLTAVPEGYGRTYSVSHPFVNHADIGQKDEDVMSVSLMSVASSSSLASEVLERTRKRQEFWSK